MKNGTTETKISFSILSLRYLLLTLSILTIVRCGKSDEGSPSPAPEADKYESYWYYSYEAERVLTAEDLSADDFTPYTLGSLGDTLFVACNADNSLLLFDTQREKVLRTLDSWDFNGEQKHFDSRIEAIVPTAGRLYVAERESRIHCFTLPALEYAGCIGNGNWNNAVFQAQAVAVADGLVFSRDKNGTVSLYREADVTPANYQQVSRYRRSAAVGAVNNNFATHCMRPDGAGRLLLTDYNQRKIHVLDISAAAEMENDAALDLPEQALSPAFAPTGLAVTPERYYVTGGNGIHIYDRADGNWSKSLPAIGGHAFSQPAYIQAQADSVFWISDISKRALVKMAVHKNEIREYERAGRHLLRVSEPAARGASREFFVDMRTHEIVEEPSVQ
ncbi:quinoprotein amine dehydrogenase [uncultured Alistipes sp.]|uniref:quinoprotein amine dehydrogenase n=1 Tax=Alistipes TaxID=239759 RepID=UPI0026650D0D|nr:quinoprotein amine dehydrogenase [uncultured Alistipes sp.]